MNYDYLPTHDHFYGAFAENHELYLDEFFSKTDVISLRNQKNHSTDLESFVDYSYHDFSFEVGSKKKGIWDIVCKVNAKGKRKSEYKTHESREVKANYAFCVEYKTSIEESDINELLRQIQSRSVPNYLVDLDSLTHTPIFLLVTFDDRFERFRKVIENEGISLVVLDSSKISDIKEDFCFSDSSDSGKDLGDF